MNKVLLWKCNYNKFAAFVVIRSSLYSKFTRHFQRKNRLHHGGMIFCEPSKPDIPKILQVFIVYRPLHCTSIKSRWDHVVSSGLLDKRSSVNQLPNVLGSDTKLLFRHKNIILNRNNNNNLAENGEVGDKVLHWNFKVSPMYTGILLVKEKPTTRAVHTPVCRRQTGSWASPGPTGTIPG